MNPRLSLGVLTVLGASLAACGGSAASGSSSTDPGQDGGSGGTGGSGATGNLGACSDCPPTAGYTASQCAAGDNVEIHLCKDGHHFTSVITTQAGALVIRTHPGNDPNGWGSSLYLHAFLSRTAGLAGASAVIASVGADGIAVQGSGPVNGNGTSRFGNWSWNLIFSYDAGSKTVWTTNGTYSISLGGTLGATGSDLDLLRISSNFLHDVPLLVPPGTIGDTGDMKEAQVSARHLGNTGGSFGYTWVPPQAPSFYPRKTADEMTIDTLGQYNVVDTASQDAGYQIVAAYKPGLTVTLASHKAGIPMIFGAAYDTTRATDFAADNVGITPIVLQSWNQKSLAFDVTLVSTALPGDP